MRKCSGQNCVDDYLIDDSCDGHKAFHQHTHLCFPGHRDHTHHHNHSHTYKQKQSISNRKQPLMVITTDKNISL